MNCIICGHDETINLHTIEGTDAVMCLHHIILTAQTASRVVPAAFIDELTAHFLHRQVMETWGNA